MRVLLVAKPWRGGLSYYVFRALQSVFPDSVQWLPMHPLTIGERLRYRRDRAGWRHRLVERINVADYDLGLFIGTFPELAQLKRRPGNVLWLNDDPRPRLKEAHAFATVYISDPGYSEDLCASVMSERFAGVLPFAHLSEFHRNIRGDVAGDGVCFIGNRDPKRDAPMERLAASRLSAHIYGNHFLRHSLFWRYPHRFRPRVPIRAMAAVYRHHQVSLNVHAQVVRGGTNMRTFECAGYGIPQVVEYLPGLDEFFEPEREILVYHSLDEMVTQLERLIADRRLADTLAVQAHKRALAEHTYEHRIRAVCRDLGL